ncbi:MAG: hypothetical protein J7K31_02865 [Candidatus Aenigmarchaeota archaeon]|nr:hypothetical protein [Candidatus Aenigmarchaeota archaeon]
MVGSRSRKTNRFSMLLKKKEYRDIQKYLLLMEKSMQKKYMALFKIGAIGDVDHIFVVRKDDLPENKGEWPKSKEELDEANIPYVMCYQIGKEYHVFT